MCVLRCHGKSVLRTWEACGSTCIGLRRCVRLRITGGTPDRVQFVMGVGSLRMYAVRSHILLGLGISM